MAQGKTGCSLRRRLQNVSLALTFAWIFVLFAGGLLRGDDSVVSGAIPAGGISTRLEYQEVEAPLMNWSVGLKEQSTAFPKEPATASGKTVRGVLNLDTNRSNSIPFIWQQSAGKLYLDLNRNHDLTEDSNGVFAAIGQRPGDYQSFTNIRLTVATAAGRCPIMANFTFSRYGSRLNCHAALRSYWQGKLTLPGQDWQVGIIQSFSNPGSRFENGQMLLRPWEKRGERFSFYDGSLATVPFTKKLFFGQTAYQVELKTELRNNLAEPTLKFIPQTVPLGQLTLNGEFIQRIQMSSESYFVVLDQPVRTVEIPTGGYRPPQVRLENKGTPAYCTSHGEPTGAQFQVTDKAPLVLAVGGPLTNTVRVNRRGHELRLDYQLVGAGGQAYQLSNRDPQMSPAFTIHKGTKKVASGTFEYG